ncbi:hypothetical protein MOO44_00145 (plasmid) [Nicoliella spurrieriana]|uniref:Uncharacterized protein n=1 Tax=Nicoliella spurrieriana TaxID=2925830 RepID=A0A976RQR0_9LACO|nr:hypothetical protein [Nicoliella spurrieriana]UQS86089.1 hypothetical protein MOO44_00145 [Nicoliella spurrieriana]
MRMFIINLCAANAAIWLSAGFAHLIFGWYNFDQSQKFNRIFWKSQGLGAMILIIAFMALWSVHLKFFTTKPMLLESLFSGLILIGIPVIKSPIKKLFFALKTYEED